AASPATGPRNRRGDHIRQVPGAGRGRSAPAGRHRVLVRRERHRDPKHADGSPLTGRRLPRVDRTDAPAMTTGPPTRGTFRPAPGAPAPPRMLLAQPSFATKLPLRTGEQLLLPPVLPATLLALLAARPA